MKIHRASVPILTLAVVVWSAPAFAGHARPGVWRETTTSQIQSPVMPTGTDSKRTDSGTYCRTAEEALRDSPPVVGRDCTQRNIKWVANTVAGETACGPPISGAGKFWMTFTGGTHYVGGYDFRSFLSGSDSYRMTTNFTADWVSAKCGAVRPLR